MSQIVVSDSTCLIALERIQRLDLLPAVFETVWIPMVVAREFGHALPWLRVKDPENAAAVAAFQLLVDAGEAAAIELAKELNCEVILDDVQARRLAERQSVPCVGLLGVLVRAKRAGKLPVVRPVVEALRNEKFFISQELIAEALRLAGE